MANNTIKKENPAVAVQEEYVLTEGIIAVDNGGSGVKVFTPDMDKPWITNSKKMFGHNNFKMQTESYTDESYSIKWNGKIYFFGLMMIQSKRKLSGRTNSKSTDFFILDILRACALKGYDINHVITPTPISRYSEEEINLIKERLIGHHELEINGNAHQFEIRQAEVAPESSIASFLTRPLGVRRWLDLGSRTVGYASTYGTGDIDNPIVPMEGEDQFTNPSGTIEKEGLDIRNVLDREDDELREYLVSYVENIYDQLSPIWDDNDIVTAFGGGAMVEPLIEELRKRYPNLEVAEEPVTLQVRAMLEYATYFDIFGLNQDDED